MSGEKSLEAWGFVRKVLDDLTGQITADARDERELLEGLRVLNRVTALCTELSVDTDPDHPHFVDMSTPFRFVGGPNPHGSYPLAMISGDRAYRVTGTRGTSTYLGLQVLAGTGMNPRRMSNYLSDRDLTARRRRPVQRRLRRRPPRRQRPGRRPVGRDPRRRHLDRGARLHRRPDHRNPCAA